MVFKEIVPSLNADSMADKICITIQTRHNMQHMRIMIGYELVEDMDLELWGRCCIHWGYGKDRGRFILRSGDVYQLVGTKSVAIKVSTKTLGIYCRDYTDPMICRWEIIDEDGIIIKLPDEFKYKLSQLGEDRTKLAKMEDS